MVGRPNTIAIDGPAGSGKSSVSVRLAERLGFLFFDTGVFYRALTYLVLQAGLAVDDEAAIVNLLAVHPLQIQRAEGSDYRLLAGAVDITGFLRSAEVEQHVSQVAQLPQVRAALLPLQQQVGQQGNIIMAGRDIGTVILPEADLKLFIDASPAERARRRHQQLRDQGQDAVLADIEKAMVERDRIDSERAVAPLVMANDAIYIMTDNRSLEEVVQQIYDMIEAS
ncbi:MAG: (d)CMP kinase [Anaerolineae bacterium]|nr:(d)CMP kinase [Anaerolineae bacterium]